MTAIAWAITFICLVFYGDLWAEEFKASGVDNKHGKLIAFCFVMLIICTVMELIKK